MSEGAGLKRSGNNFMDVDLIESIPEGVVAPSQPVRARRPKAVYRLSDFIIQRTLGTGSFGRVHLGRFSASTCT